VVEVDSNSEADFVFEAIDYSDTPVVLSRATSWQTKAGNDEPLVPEPHSLRERKAAMAENGDFRQLIGVRYNPQGDILTFSFTKEPRPAVAEEAANEIWVRYEEDPHRVVTVDILNFSERVLATFGPRLAHTERTDPQRLEALEPLKALRAGENDE